MWLGALNAITSCNLHGACGGKALDMAEDIEELSLQSARSVWRQRIRCFSRLQILQVAICTERVESKSQSTMRTRRAHVAICTERVEAKIV